MPERKVDLTQILPGFKFDELDWSSSSDGNGPLTSNEIPLNQHKAEIQRNFEVCWNELCEKMQLTDEEKARLNLKEIEELSLDVGTWAWFTFMKMLCVANLPQPINIAINFICIEL